MYDLKEKKIKLKEILKLLKQQMDALKREIDIFRRKGGHIYSTIASNLVQYILFINMKQAKLNFVKIFYKN